MHLRNCVSHSLVLLFSALFSYGADARADAPRAPVCGPVASSFQNTTPVTITDNSTGTSTILVSGLPPFIWDVDLVTNITHTFAGDLDITLQSPAGTIVTISSDNGGGSDNVFNGTLFDDSGNANGTAVPHANNGNPGLITDHTFVSNTVATRLVPEEPLAAFFGENPNGTWTLKIHDDAGQDTGALALWGLNLVALPEVPVLGAASGSRLGISVPIPDNRSGTATSTIEVAGASGVICGLTVATRFPHTFSGDLQSTLRSPAGTEATLISNNGGGNDNVFVNTLFSVDADPTNNVPFPSSTFAASFLATDTTYTDLVSKASLTPEESFGTFYGQSPNGTWTLTAADTGTAGETGTLNDWSFQITTCRPAVDIDGDNFGDACDGCPSDANKSSAGQCGCGVAEVVTDGDSDGVIDCLDQCSADAAKSAPGVCGCGAQDLDQNGNGIVDCLLNQELKSRSAKVRSLIGRLKPATTSNAVKKLRATRKAVSENLSEMVNFTNLHLSAFTIAQGANLPARLEAARKAVRAAAKALSTTTRKKAIRTLSELDAALS